MPAIRRCNKGTIVDGRVNNPNRTGWNACNINYRKIHGSLQLARKVVLDQVAYENKARGVKGL